MVLISSIFLTAVEDEFYTSYDRFSYCMIVVCTITVKAAGVGDCYVMLSIFTIHFILTLS